MQTYIDSNVHHTHVNANGGEKRNYGGRLMEGVAKLRPWERKVENEKGKGLWRGAKERMFSVMGVLISPRTLELSYWTVRACVAQCRKCSLPYARI